MKHLLLTAAGFILLGFGVVGVFVPVLPTTPFVLSASACFTGNPKLRVKLLKSNFFREHYVNYKERTGLKKRTVAVSLSFLWGTLCISMLIVRAAWCTALLLCVGIAVTAHLLCMARRR